MSSAIVVQRCFYCSQCFSHTTLALFRRLAAMSGIQDAIDEFCALLRRRQIHGPLPCAKRTAELMRLMVTNQKHADAASLVDECRAVGHRIQSAVPCELSVGNVARRVLHIIREEAQHEASEQEEEPPQVMPSSRGSDPT